jgi:hypothetical protein
MNMVAANSLLNVVILSNIVVPSAAASLPRNAGLRRCSGLCGNLHTRATALFARGYREPNPPYPEEVPAPAAPLVFPPSVRKLTCIM